MNCLKITPTSRATRKQPLRLWGLLMKSEKVKCYAICSYESNSMKSSNPHSGIYEAKTARCLDLNGGNPTCNQGGCLSYREGSGMYISTRIISLLRLNPLWAVVVAMFRLSLLLLRGTVLDHPTRVRVSMTERRCLH